MKKILFSVMALVMAISLNAQIFSDDFQSENIDGWVTVSPNYATNAYNWHIADYETDFYMSVAAYDGTANLETVQWVISPAFDASGLTSFDITFDNRGKYEPLQALEVYVSTDFAGDSASFDAATWVKVTGFTWDESYDDYDWVLATTATATIDGTATTYLAFKYVSEDGGDGNGGNWTVNNVVVATAGSGVQNLTSGVTIYPNPVYNTLNIKNVNTIANVQILNVIGQEVISNAYNAKSVSINTEVLTNGVYFVKVTNTNGQTSVTKIVKK